MPALIVVKILVFFLGLAVHSEFWIEVEADLLEKSILARLYNF